MVGEEFNVRHFGAVGDNANRDDAPYIHLALAAARKTGQYGTVTGQGQPVHVPAGVYRVDTPLNLTGSQFNLRGAGRYETVIRGNTGGSSGLVVDMASSGWSSLRDLQIDTVGVASPSTIGILQARANAVGAEAVAENLRNVVVRLPSIASANNLNGTVGIANVAAEITTYDSVYVLADVGVFLGSGKSLSNGTTPPYSFSSPNIGAIQDNASATVVSFRGTSTIWSYRGPAVRISGGAVIDLGDSHLSSQPVAGVTPYPYAIEVLVVTHALRYSGSMENYKTLLYVGAPIVGTDLACYASHDTDDPRIVLGAGGEIRGGRIDVVPNAGPAGGNLIQAASGVNPVVRGLDINLYEQGIDLNGGTLEACTIRSNRTLAATKLGIVAGTRRGNVILASDGVHVDGVTPW